MLISIVKMWGMLSYTNIQEILIYHSNDYIPEKEQEEQEEQIETETKLFINFNEILFIDFIKYWKQYNDFRTYFIMNSDIYYRYNIIYFLDYFINKYEDVKSNNLKESLY